MEDWVEHLHQTGMHLRQRFCTVQNPAIRANACEKASSRSLHPDVIAHTDAMNLGNKQSFSVAMVEDTILTRQKKQHDMGQYEAMQYFKKEGKMNKLTWLVLIFDNVKGAGKGNECKSSACHLENKMRAGDFLENASDT